MRLRRDVNFLILNMQHHEFNFLCDTSMMSSRSRGWPGSARPWAAFKFTAHTSDSARVLVRSSALGKVRAVQEQLKVRGCRLPGTCGAVQLCALLEPVLHPRMAFPALSGVPSARVPLCHGPQCHGPFVPWSLSSGVPLCQDLPVPGSPVPGSLCARLIPCWAPVPPSARTQILL